MNFFTTANEIIQSPLTDKERDHHSRKRRGYHVFLSSFFTNFSALEYENKRAMLIELKIWRREEYESDDDSVITPRQPAPGEVMKAAGRVWAASSVELKNSWGERASKLNMMPVNDGTFESIPHVLVQNSLRSEVMQSLTMDWRQTVSLFRRSMLSNQKRMITISQMRYKFGKESVVLHSQAYRSFFMNYLLKLTIFGNPSFCNLFPYEIPYSRKKQTVIHIYSHRRMSELFSFGGLDASELYKDGVKYFVCGKVNLRKGKKNVIGYIMDEDEEMLHVKVEGERQNIRIKRPEYNSEHGRFEYEKDPRMAQALTYSLSQLWPVRMKIMQSGQVSYILSVYTFGVD